MKSEERILTPVAGYAGRLLAELSSGADELLAKVVARLFEVLEEGGACVKLSEFGDADEVAERLKRLPVVGGAGVEAPLIVDGGLVYFERYHAYEAKLAARLLTLSATRREVPAGLTGDEVRILAQGLGVVTGGPGTGKTTLASRLVTGLALVSEGGLSVALAAPTGKAAARISESVEKAAGAIPGLSLFHGTVHRLLGVQPDSVRFRHNASRPLLYDVVILDESSMMDLPLFEKLVEAIDPASTRLLLLGDPDQLPSIHSGSVLGDIVAAAERGGALSHCFLRLQKNHRSEESPSLAALVDASRTGDASRAVEILQGGEAVNMVPPPAPKGMESFVARELMPYMQALHSAKSPQEALEVAKRFRLICMLRQGPCGADAANALALTLAEKLGFARRGERFFHGMPLIVTRNEHRLNLFNGDSGVIFRENGRLCAYFDSEEGPRAVPVQNLPPTEAAYALTVHRAQGSEYASVTLLLPPQDHPLLTRELFYTGVSRARWSVNVAGTPELLRLAFSRTIGRASGLAERLK